MEQALPIIFALIWIGFKLYKKSVEASEKSSNQPRTSQNQDLNELINSAFESFKPQFVEPQPKRNFSKSDDFYTLETQEEIKPEPTQSVESENYKSVKDRKPQLFEINKNKEEIRPEVSDFELRKAVIYNAILNRPYR